MLTNRDRGSVPFSDINRAIDLLKDGQEAASASPNPAPPRISAAEAKAIYQDHLETLERLKKHAQAFLPDEDTASHTPSRSAGGPAPTPDTAPSSAVPSNTTPSDTSSASHFASPSNVAPNLNPSLPPMFASPSNSAPSASGSGAGASSAGGLRMIDDHREFTRYGDGATGSGSGEGWAPEDRDDFWRRIESKGSGGDSTGGGGSSEGPSGGGSGSS